MADEYYRDLGHFFTQNESGQRLWKTWNDRVNHLKNTLPYTLEGEQAIRMKAEIEAIERVLLPEIRSAVEAELNK